MENGDGVCRDLDRHRRAAPNSAPGFPWGLGLDRQRVYRVVEFRRKRCVNHAVAFDPALPLEGRRHNIDPEMRLAARPVAGMALMQM
jgi:hypothetical protein